MDIFPFICVGARMKYPPTTRKQACLDSLTFTSGWSFSESKNNAASIFTKSTGTQREV